MGTWWWCRTEDPGLTRQRGPGTPHQGVTSLAVCIAHTSTWYHNRGIGSSSWRIEDVLYLQDDKGNKEQESKSLDEKSTRIRVSQLNFDQHMMWNFCLFCLLLIPSVHLHLQQCVVLVLVGVPMWPRGTISGPLCRAADLSPLTASGCNLTQLLPPPTSIVMSSGYHLISAPTSITIDLLQSDILTIPRAITSPSTGQHTTLPAPCCAVHWT